MAFRIRACAVAVSLVFASCATVKMKPVPTGQHPESFDKAVTRTYHGKYLLFLPGDYNKDRKKLYPTILFLHGAGERGDNLELVKKHGPPKIVEQKPDFPFIVISPQCPSEQWWPTDWLIPLLDDLTARYRIDPDRVYLTGLSMGGFGTWDLAIQNPNRFAAIAPICGGGNAYRASRIKGVPVWVFHGGKDPVVPLKASEDMVNALKKAGADVKLTVYPDAGHDSWTETYNNQELYDWFLSHKRNAPEKGK